VGHGNFPTDVLSKNQKQADVLRCLKQYAQYNPSKSVFVWVKAHQDDSPTFENLLLAAQLNTLVDELAKNTLRAACLNRQFISNLFPFEQVRFSVCNNKIASSPKNAIMAAWADDTAQDVFHNRNIIDRSNFDLIWWASVEITMTSFPKMFQVWWTKEVLPFCGTNRQLSKIDKSVKNVGPSCGRIDELSTHITHCKDKGRVTMLKHLLMNSPH